MTIWTEIQIEVAPAAAELVASAVAELAGGVEVRDGGTMLRAGTGRSLIVTQVAPEDADAVLAAVEETCASARAAGLPVDPVAVRRREADEAEWRDVWKQYFRATRVGRRFLVRPTWDPGTATDGDRIIDIDPGRAFGTGGHASTRLCMMLAEEDQEARVERAREPARPVARFLDLGCGSGILSVAAARLWPVAAGLAVDVDPEATACALENLERNGVRSVQTCTGALADVPAPPGEAPGFDLVLANIQADVLIPLAPALRACLRPGATLILSGLLREDGPPTASAYQATGLVLLAERAEDEWVGLRLQAPPAP